MPKPDRALFVDGKTADRDPQFLLAVSVDLQYFYSGLGIKNRPAEPGG